MLSGKLKCGYCHGSPARDKGRIKCDSTRRGLICGGFGSVQATVVERAVTDALAQSLLSDGASSFAGRIAAFEATEAEARRIAIWSLEREIKDIGAAMDEALDIRLRGSGAAGDNANPHSAETLSRLGETLAGLKARVPVAMSEKLLCLGNEVRAMMSEGLMGDEAMIAALSAFLERVVLRRAVDDRDIELTIRPKVDSTVECGEMVLTIRR